MTGSSNRANELRSPSAYSRSQREREPQRWWTTRMGPTVERSAPDPKSHSAPRDPTWKHEPLRVGDDRPFSDVMQHQTGADGQDESPNGDCNVRQTERVVGDEPQYRRNEGDVGKVDAVGCVAKPSTQTGDPPVPSRQISACSDFSQQIAILHRPHRHDMGVAIGGQRRGVAELLLDARQRFAPPQHQGRNRVAQIVDAPPIDLRGALDLAPGILDPKPLPICRGRIKIPSWRTSCAAEA